MAPPSSDRQRPAPESESADTAAVIELTPKRNLRAQTSLGGSQPPPAPSARARLREAPPPPPETTRHPMESATASVGFSAQIEGATMADLVQLECMRGLTRAVRVSAGSKLGFLYFDQGQLVHAVAGRLSGQVAALEILTWDEGSVRPSKSYWVNPPTITTHWQGLLLGAAQVRDERKHGSDVEGRAPEVELSLTAHVEKENSPIMNYGSAPASGVIRVVRLDATGEIIQGEGEVGDFPETAAYCVRLAQLVGEGLGLEGFRGLECITPESTTVMYLEEDQIVAAEAKEGSLLQAQKERAGV